MPRLSASGFDLTPPDVDTLERRAAALTPEERHILLHQGTERPFCGGYLDNKAHGIYQCKLCDLPLFRAEHKFNSGTGWPSFFDSVDADHVRTLEDHSHGMHRIEIRCGRCDSHLGHVFPDGPAPTGLRYCLNSASLQFVAE
jgi:peptide-methionine (R)-S-oxide reductase